MLFHNLLFFFIQFPRLEQNFVGDTDFPNIVHGAGLKHELACFIGQAYFFRQFCREPAHANDVHARFIVPVFCGPAQAKHDFLPGFFQFAGSLLDFFLKIRF